MEEELKAEYQTFLQKCCEVGQIKFQIDQLDVQRHQMEKNLEKAEREVRTSAEKHRQLQRTELEKAKPEATT